VTPEQAFLTRVAQRLGRSVPLKEPPAGVPSDPLPSVGPTDPEALAGRFQAELEKLSGHVTRVTTEAAVAPTVVRILKQAGVRGTVVRWQDPTLDGLGLDEALQAAGYEVVPFAPGADGGSLMQAAARAGAGITGCDGAVAETGTVVLGSSCPGVAGAPGRGRVVSLLPPVHVVVLRREQIVYGMADLLRRLGGGPLPSQVIFATGPSRSSDIENDLSIGVHGPGVVHVILL